MKEFAAALLTLLKDPPETAWTLPPVEDGWQVAPHAFRRFGDRAVVFVAEKEGDWRLGVAALREKHLPEGFSGERSPLPGGAVLLLGNGERRNAAALRRHFPKCAPAVPGAGDVLTEAADFSGSVGDFLLFAGTEADLCALRDKLTFAAFACGMAKKYALGGTARDAAAAARLLDCGATCVELAPEAVPKEELPAEYRGKSFVLTPRHAIEIADGAFYGGVIREAEKVARLATAHHAAWRLRLNVTLSAAEHLALARELYRRNAAPQVWAASLEGKMEDHAAIAAQYGKYEIKTV